MRVLPGHPQRLGATFDGSGTHFGLYSQVAERVELCLFDEGGREQSLTLPSVQAGFHSGYLPGVGVGQLYGFRVHGPYQPEQGQLCNPRKLLVDPYARAVSGRLRWDDARVFGHVDQPGSAASDVDSAAFVPKSVVIDDHFDWQGDAPLSRPWDETVLYEVHVKNFTARHPDIPVELRGTFAGLAHPASIRHFQQLGVTALELMPVFQFEDENFLHKRSLHNHWGYNPLTFFAPHNGYALAPHDGAQVREFKRMVQTLHAAGLEVILDVVYNHTAEGDAFGPTVMFRGIDNALYYRRRGDAPGQYLDFTGCGNTVNLPHPQVLTLVTDSLRYWVSEMHVDGFRFDLACTLGRNGSGGFEQHGPFLSALRQDPLLRTVKLIAEPWDLGDGGYQVGGFPWPWREWNGKFRDHFRDYWRGMASYSPALVERFTGSPDLYSHGQRGPLTGINFITAHDGFTLRDLVSYNEKHNAANGEDNRDGESYNRSWNGGVEGPTQDATINALRARQQRNLLLTLLFAQGVPMLLSGDELGRSQQGNNNAYCQDNEISWLDWQHSDAQLLQYTRRLIELRKSEPLLRCPEWSTELNSALAISWFRPDGTQLNGDAHDPPRALCIVLSSTAVGVDPRHGFVLLFNPTMEAVNFYLPEQLQPEQLRIEIDTAQAAGEPHSNSLPSRLVELTAHSALVLRGVV